MVTFGVITRLFGAILNPTVNSILWKHMEANTENRDKFTSLGIQIILHKIFKVSCDMPALRNSKH